MSCQALSSHHLGIRDGRVAARPRPGQPSGRAVPPSWQERCAVRGHGLLPCAAATRCLHECSEEGPERQHKQAYLPTALTPYACTACICHEYFPNSTGEEERLIGVAALMIRGHVSRLRMMFRGAAFKALSPPL